jgi:hypothetical protein
MRAAFPNTAPSTAWPPMEPSCCSIHPCRPSPSPLPSRRFGSVRTSEIPVTPNALLPSVPKTANGSPGVSLFKADRRSSITSGVNGTGSSTIGCARSCGSPASAGSPFDSLQNGMMTPGAGSALTAAKTGISTSTASCGCDMRWSTTYRLRKPTENSFRTARTRGQATIPD